MIGEEQINKMKKGGFIINASRGNVINEVALIQDLITSDVAGVALDFF
ncbi:MAG: NAD(P)-dependent oxidoreductase [Candidatus Bathyarchaeia archaeon]